MATLLFLIGLTGLCAAIGRTAIPARERLPWHAWTAADLTANVARGARLLLEPSPRHRQLLEAQLDELHPRRRRRHQAGKEQDESA